MLQIKKAMLALSMLTVLSVSAMHIEKDSLSMSQSLQDVSVFHEEDRTFTIEDNLGAHTLQSHQLSKELRNVPTEKLSKMLTAGAYLRVNRSLDGSQYSVDLQQRVRGGGAFGAWLGATIGYGGVTLVGHGAIHLIALCTGPAYTPVSATLEKMLAIPIHKAAISAGVAIGMAGAVATGPV